jgi:hypothetical protein
MLYLSTAYHNILYLIDDKAADEGAGPEIHRELDSAVTNV